MPTKKNKLFVIIDETLEPIYGCVQAGHAVAQWLIEHPNRQWCNDYLIYLKGRVDEWIGKLKLLGIDYSVFKEPDLNGKMTAIAVHGNDRLFRKISLYNFNIN